MNITNKYEGGQFEAQNASYKLSGNYQKNPTTGKVTSLNASVNAVADNSYIGDVSAYLNGSELKYNLNNISIQHLSGVATAVGELVTALEAADAE